MAPPELLLLVLSVCCQALLLQPHTSAASRVSLPQPEQMAGASRPSVMEVLLVHRRPMSSTALPTVFEAGRMLQWLLASPHGETI